MDLSNHKDTLTLNIGDGRDRLWLFGNKAFRLAEERGYDMDGLLDRYMNMSDLGAYGRVKLAGEMLWVGLLPFDDDLPDCQTLYDSLDLESLGRLLPVMFGSIQTDVDDGPVGKAKGRRRPSG